MKNFFIKNIKNTEYLKNIKKSEEYIYHKGYRIVKPYQHEYQITTKKENQGKSLITAITNYFSISVEEGVDFIKSKILLNKKPCKEPYHIIKPSDLITYQQKNKLEGPAMDFSELEKIFENDHILVINKPPSYTGTL
jgi:23S rRNA-/tRNA-specific pseudouridylate synthase